MERQRNSMLEMNATRQGRRTGQDYPAWLTTQKRRVQPSPRRSGSLERCWTALPIVPVGARSVMPAAASLLATAFKKSRFDGPVRFGR
jgi:hypothetical protein